MHSYKTLKISISDHIAVVKFNRPEKANALNDEVFEDMHHAFVALDMDDTVRVIILMAEGKHFCSGIDLSILQNISQTNQACGARKSENLRKQILNLQASISAIENCSKPVITAVSGGCIGAGLDVISACDMRYASEDAFFCIKEIDMGIVADLGTLQRLPRLIPEGLVRELAFTGRNVLPAEAEKIGLVNRYFQGRNELNEAVHAIAADIASKSPVSVRGTKHILNYSRDHSVSEGLNYIATWNAAMLLSEDLTEVFTAKQEKRNPEFRD
ncbi:crotonase/enoyl-CoA hydratase family protein [Dyadobacter sp. CY312]|uniref:crotonase/enoyl-CoA hydratase family protein n=1 Tax=Dyadobacter sp. CY312 TaxID=2907303 RepID=UPI001F2BA895|nr:crotonase/enoyl-CoA hydratase family protein [Dyadobacter sp. CY312]MCE7039983.1 crotonase/enoyl-CoA hydratase family protein [Dyadobacter sp. CY312]